MAAQASRGRSERWPSVLNWPCRCAVVVATRSGDVNEPMHGVARCGPVRGFRSMETVPCELFRGDIRAVDPGPFIEAVLAKRIRRLASACSG
jgi:hypothetical protein